MGVSSLNYYMQTACPKGTKKMLLKHFKGKRIAVDISIYLYKFKAEGSILDNMYIMCTIFKKYNITPIFIFDGKPPPEKEHTLRERKKRKKLAEDEYHLMEKNLAENSTHATGKKIREKMKKLKKKFVRIKNWEIALVKKFFNCSGIAYIDATGEADMVCAKMTMDGDVDACLSDDMDLFVYGCPYVLRYLNLIQQTVMLYDLQLILDTIHMTHDEFKQVCILAGTDYSRKKKTKSFYYYYQLFKRFKKSKRTNFYKWIHQHQITVDSIENLEKNIQMFNVSIINIPPISKCKPANQPEIQKLLEEQNFIFPPSI